MEITIQIGGPLADAINNLAAALQAGGLIDRAQTKATPKAKAKTEPVAPAPEVEPAPLPAAEAPVAVCVACSSSMAHHAPGVGQAGWSKSRTCRGPAWKTGRTLTPHAAPPSSAMLSCCRPSTATRL